MGDWLSHDRDTGNSRVAREKAGPDQGMRPRRSRARATLHSWSDQSSRALSLVVSTKPGPGLGRGWPSGSRAVGVEAQAEVQA